MALSAQALEFRKAIARQLIESHIDDLDRMMEVDQAALESAELTALPEPIAFPEGLAPIPQPINPKPHEEAPLPEADILIVTWTVAEQSGLADVMTPGYSRHQWYRYRRNFEDHYLPLIRTAEQDRRDPPSRQNNRLGSWFISTVGDLKVVCFKSELHLNQDGIWLNEDGTQANRKTGYATLPVKDMFEQLIAEVKPSHVLTTGTSGAVYLNHNLGDVVITRGAKFRLTDEFTREPYNGLNIEGAQYKSVWDVPNTYFQKAEELMGGFKHHLKEPIFTTPTKRFTPNTEPTTPWPNDPAIRMDGTGELPEFHPIISTDFFEFGTSANNMEALGSAVEMGDAVLGLVCEEMDNPPKWLVLRNISDPQINADLPNHPRELNMQVHWAVWYYEVFGYWTSINGALATWAVIAGLQSQGENHEQIETSN
uniref:Uncharacterized protein n=1 Tax=Rheinheimera sp. BAL341 TaxID=1708203 RepID=A0A486XUQ1_9GAMM